MVLKFLKSKKEVIRIQINNKVKIRSREINCPRTYEPQGPRICSTLYDIYTRYINIYNKRVLFIFH